MHMAGQSMEMPGLPAQRGEGVTDMMWIETEEMTGCEMTETPPVVGMNENYPEALEMTSAQQARGIAGVIETGRGGEAEMA